MGPRNRVPFIFERTVMSKFTQVIDPFALGRIMSEATHIRDVRMRNPNAMIYILFSQLGPTRIMVDNNYDVPTKHDATYEKLLRSIVHSDMREEPVSKTLYNIQVMNRVQVHDARNDYELIRRCRYAAIRFDEFYRGHNNEPLEPNSYIAIDTTLGRGKGRSYVFGSQSF